MLPILAPPLGATGSASADRTGCTGRASGTQTSAPRDRLPPRRRAPTSPRRVRPARPGPGGTSVSTRPDPNHPRSAASPIGSPSAPPPSHFLTGNVFTREPNAMNGRPAGRGGVPGAWTLAGTPFPRPPTTSRRRRSSPSCRPPSAVCEPMPLRIATHPPDPSRADRVPSRSVTPSLTPNPVRNPSPATAVEGTLLTKLAMRAVRRLLVFRVYESTSKSVAPPLDEVLDADHRGARRGRYRGSHYPRLQTEPRMLEPTRLADESRTTECQLSLTPNRADLIARRSLPGDGKPRSVTG